MTNEKLSAYTLFVKEIETIELEDAKKLLAKLYLLHLNQQSIFQILPKN